MIPINTPVGKFKVWTKRFGNNPKIKILLIHGGPAMTHEYMECFETFFQREGFEFYVASIRILLQRSAKRTAVYGLLIAL